MINVKRRTPRTDMVYHTIIGRAAAMYEDFAEEHNFLEGVVDLHLARFARLSSRCEAEAQLDFELIDKHDDAEAITAKFLAYMDTEFMEAVDVAMLEIDRMDRPVEPALAPELPEDAEKN